MRDVQKWRTWWKTKARAGQTEPRHPVDDMSADAVTAELGVVFQNSSPIVRSGLWSSWSGWVVLGVIVLTMIAFGAQAWTQTSDAQRRASLQAVGVIGATLPDVAQHALDGDDQAFVALRNHWVAMGQLVSQGSPASLSVAWSAEQAWMAPLLRNQVTLQAAHAAAQTVVQQSQQLIAQGARLLPSFVNGPGQPVQGVYLSHAMTLTAEISQRASIWSAGGAWDAESVQGMTRDRVALDQLWSALLEGSSAVPAITDPTLRQAVQNLADAWAGWRPAVDQMIQAGGVRQELQRQQQLWSSSSQQEQLALAKMLRDEDDNQTQNMVWQVLSGVLALASMIALALWGRQRKDAVGTSVADFHGAAWGDVEHILDHVRRDLAVIEQGDWTHRIRPLPVIAEMPLAIGRWFKQCQQTIDGLLQILQNHQATLKAIEQDGRQIKASAEELLDNWAKQNGVMQESSQGVQALAATVQSTVHQAMESGDAAAAAVEASVRGRQAMDASQASMIVLRERMDDALARAKRLQQASTEIGQLADAMTDLAEQAAVMAINTGVQAAKAGEAGRSFRVIADNVQGLADQAGTAARRVVALNETALSDLDAMVLAVNRATEETNKSALSTDLTRQALSTVEDVALHLKTLVGSVKDLATEQGVRTERLQETLQSVTHVAGAGAQQTQKTLQAVERWSRVGVLDRSILGETHHG